MGVNAGATIAGLSALAKRIDTATRGIADDAAEAFKLAVQAEAPVGTPGNTTNAPGDLKESVLVTGPEGGDGVYTALIGPTMVYSRQRELGGPIFPVRARMLVFTKFDVTYFRTRVFQEPDPYTKRGYDSVSSAELEAIVVERMTAALIGS